MASAPSRRSCSTASATRLFPTRSAASSMKARRARPAASSPSPATARSPASPTPKAGAAPERSPRPRSTGSSMRRSAGRPTITPIMCFRPGPRAWPRTRSSARICSTAGAEAGVRPPPSPSAMQAASPMPPRSAPPRLPVPHITPVYGQQGQLAKAIDEIPGAQAIKLEPSLRGDKRVAVRFNLVARQASKDVAPVDYTKKFESFRQSQICAVAGHGRREPAAARQARRARQQWRR